MRDRRIDAFLSLLDEARSHALDLERSGYLSTTEARAALTADATAFSAAVAGLQSDPWSGYPGDPVPEDPDE